MFTFETPVSAQTAFNAAIIDHFDSTFREHYRSEGNRWFIGSLGGVENLARIRPELDQIIELFKSASQFWEDGDMDGLFGIVLFSQTRQPKCQKFPETVAARGDTQFLCVKHAERIVDTPRNHIGPVAQHYFI